MKLYLLRSFFVFLTITLFLTSCTSIVLSLLRVKETNISLKYISNGEKKLVFFPMHHIGKKEFYDDVKYKLDSFIKEGYVVYYEGVKPSMIKDSLQNDSIYRKARRISGVNFASMKANGGFIDTINKTLFGKKSNYVVKHNLMNQPKSLISIEDTLRYKRTDAGIIELISACENKFGPVTLNSYDFETSFNDKYKVKRDKNMKKYFLEGYRNVIISSSIINDANKKILLIYGKLHFKGILENLQAVDKNYKQVEKL